MTLHLHRAERADRLADGLGDLLADPLGDPFVSEIVSVPTQGVERWLSQTLSHRLGTAGGRAGVCAGVDFSSPRRLVERATASTGLEPGHDPWDPRRAVWPLLAVIDAARDEDWAALLWSYLGVRPGLVEEDDPVRAGRRYATARHVADLFSRYATNRPAMPLAWADGHDVDGAGDPLGQDHRWQAELWRRLRAELDMPSPAERTRAACVALVDDPHLTDLPTRVSIFGATRLSTEQRMVLDALAVHRDVHLWLPHPSPQLWRRVADHLDGAQLSPEAGVTPRRDDSSVGVPRHRLLSYLGRDTRELQLTLAATRAPVQDHVHGQDPAAGSRLLSLLQHDIATDRPLSATDRRPVLDDQDHSIQLHASHGPDRQVEVLREVLVGLLANDQTLEPRDILVMCPDIETYAPLISASFGLENDESDTDHPGHRLRVRLADRSVRQLNPLLATLARLLELTESRVEAPDLLDLFASAPIARKFHFTEDDLLRIAELVARSGVRWGLDQQHRSRFQMDGFGQNTWAAGLERLLLGVTLAEDDQVFIGTTLPLDDVDSSDVDLVGRLAECVDRVRTAMTSFSGRQPLSAWIDACRTALEALTAVSSNDGWQVTHAYAELTRLAEAAGDHGDALELTLADIRSLLADTFRGRASRTNFRTGTLTMSTMLPMRSVPHRVICLLGTDDGVFPRAGATDGDDILAGQPCVGDRDARSEDRQLLLDAVMAATEHLVIIYSGADPRTNAPRPPAVPIGELLDTLDLTATTADGTPVRECITVRHPLQPFDPVNFVPNGLLRAPGPFSFDHASMAGARSAAGERTPPRQVFDRTPLDPVTVDDVISLEDLTRFFNHPIKVFLRQRAGLSLYQEDPLPDEIPVALDGLESWSIGERLLRLQLRGVDPQQTIGAAWRRGDLPPQMFGERALTPVVRTVADLASVADRFTKESRTSVDAIATLGEDGGGRSVVGTVTGVYGDDIVMVTYSRLAAKHRFQSWLRLLAMTATDPTRPWRAISIGRRGTSVLGPIQQPDHAAIWLADLVGVYAIGLREPLPLASKSSFEYARLRHRGQDIAVITEAVGGQWRDDRDDAYGLFFGAGLDDLMAQASVPGEQRGDLGEPSRFGTLARRVWTPLLRAEEML